VATVSWVASWVMLPVVMVVAPAVTVTRASTT
jgi:hypothetical protein